ncbi:MAG: electron transport complex subunit RsxE [endosymbiont of Galathealinum brachiosum]|uniref:Ion-translocating oxidoreductase complex subunit E n=1 Tax=endosymbiont of Galathealinum brachiosum TaxID=2200906 RepID=A0A370DAW3_9GAMM|nr:MAG: electron transport complex subunit RsxE [endosymbiont of Galathealinum brachiosum]
MNDDNYNEISKNGLWNNNVALVQLLGLCPLLAVTGTVINGLGLGMATMLTLIISNAVVSLIRHLVRPEVRVPVFVLVIASVVTAIELSMNAWLYELYTVLGIFIPLIVTNCGILARAEAFASKNRLLPSIVDGLMMGFGFTLVLVTLGAIREILGYGTFFSNAHLMFGESARNWTWVFVEDYSGFLLAILPPGAFIGMGLIIALKNVIDNRNKKKKTLSASQTISATEVSV